MFQDGDDDGDDDDDEQECEQETALQEFNWVLKSVDNMMLSKSKLQLVLFGQQWCWWPYDGDVLKIWLVKTLNWWLQTFLPTFTNKRSPYPSPTTM